MIDFLLNVFASVVGNRLDYGLLWLYRHGLPVSRRHYYRQLRALVASMPFIYKDLNLEVLSDFVDADVQTVDPKTLEKRSNRTYLERRATERLRDHRRGMLFGEGGMGKTTFFRYVVLSILERAQTLGMFNKNERLIPVFVPLKAIDNSHPFPIANALLNDCLYFSNPWGRRRLMNLARKRRLILLLDGYDETPHSGGRGALADELGALFSSLDQRVPPRVAASEYKDIYTELRFCRVYISSRKQYYLTHPLKVADDVPRWLLQGLSDTRARLVGNIFRHYARRNPAFYTPLLNHEIFINELEAAADRAFVELSRNPLFLTVIVFVYVNQLVQGQPRGNLFRGSSSGLINECTRLLIYEIDRAKVSDPNSIQGEALLSRRANHPEHKLMFLHHLAERVMLEQVPVFSEADLLKWATEYFQREPDDPEAKTIIAGLQLSTGNLVKELLQCGIFVKVAVSDGRSKYDFPHRRFREALAEEGMLDLVRSPQIGSAFRVASTHDLFVDAARKNRENWSAITNAVWLAVRADPVNGVQWKLLQRLLLAAPTPQQRASIAREVIMFVGADSFDSKLPEAFLAAIRVSDDLALYVGDNLREAIVAGNARAVVIYAAMLTRNNHERIIGGAAKKIDEGSRGTLVSWLALLPFISGELLGELGSAIVHRFGASSCDPAALVGVCAVGFALKSEADRATLRAALFRLLTKQAPELASDFASTERLEQWVAPFLDGATMDTTGKVLPFNRGLSPALPDVFQKKAI